MYLVLILLVLALLFLPGLWVRRVLARYRQPEDRYPGSGASFARHLLDQLGLEEVAVEATESGDHYDPTKRCVRLSKVHHEGQSLAAITVAAHEVGHAIQHADGYLPLGIRTRLAVVAGSLGQMSAVVLTVGPLLSLALRMPAAMAWSMGLGLLGMASSSLLHLVTLPVEWDASFSRALPLLSSGGYLKEGDLPHARKILLAAALTYVASSLFSLLNLWRWLRVLR
jgi:Zn-dependent membrane protease YugP